MSKSVKRLKKKDALQPPLETIGWREWLALPDLGVEFIKTKVDTGARTSALHAFDIEPFKKNGQDWIRFTLHPIQRNDKIEQACSCKIKGSRFVTNSGGIEEKRFVIVTPITIGHQTWPIEVTLTNRDEMGFRMLLGRTALRKRFLVDPAKSYCQGHPGEPKITITHPEHQSYGKDEEE
ncbi:ATP-dependent zinc protease [Candidatus Nitronereus thalassa]|uniref:ATP-dependent zinc protease n=1 Tax=Candidatus Nitronereus thalassa TaxID=3020898 RepID=A0ABU3K5Y2_9BACT|nr:ATP-dependent zinc protease [Candidatus Nitronereus thalassa]MDT7041753.1 ATP-dependent zinc protease [Candidatus Nitronereus thalassa]